MDEIENELEKDLIYFNGGGKPIWIGFYYLRILGLGIYGGLISSFGAIMFWSIFIEFQIWILLVSFILFSSLFFYLILRSERKSKLSFKIYSDRIVFFNKRYPLEKDIINLDEIDQVRYEDDFGKSYSSDVSSQSWIYCYLKNNYKANSIVIKKDRIKIYIILDHERENNIIKILQFFQKKKKQVYISTRSDKIQKALNLKNWTEPGIHPSIRI